MFQLRHSRSTHQQCLDILPCRFDQHVPPTSHWLSLHLFAPTLAPLQHPSLAPSHLQAPAMTLFPSQCLAVSGSGTSEEGFCKLSLLTKTSNCPKNVLWHKSRQQRFCQGRPRNHRRLNHPCRDIRLGQLPSSRLPQRISDCLHFLSQQSGQYTPPSRSEPHGRASFGVLTHVAMWATERHTLPSNERL